MWEHSTGLWTQQPWVQMSAPLDWPATWYLCLSASVYPWETTVPPAHSGLQTSCIEQGNPMGNACKITGLDWSRKQYFTYMSGRRQLKNLAWVTALLQGNRNLNWCSWNTPTARSSQLALHCLRVKCFCCPGDSHGYLYVLGLAGMELTFLMAAHKVLCFGYE